MDNSTATATRTRKHQLYRASQSSEKMATRRRPFTQTAFLPTFPLRNGAQLRASRRTALCRKPSRTPCATLEPPTPAQKAELDDSWRVYSKPGNLCVVCQGRGSTRCLYCFGEGQIRVGPETGRDTVICPNCSGGSVEECVRCSGSGKRPDTRYDVKTGVFVRNLTNEEVCRLRGGAGEDDAEVGELDTASNDVEVGETAAASNDVGVGERATAASNGVH